MRRRMICCQISPPVNPSPRSPHPRRHRCRLFRLRDSAGPAFFAPLQILLLPLLILLLLVLVVSLLLVLIVCSLSISSGLVSSSSSSLPPSHRHGHRCRRLRFHDSARPACFGPLQLLLPSLLVVLLLPLLVLLLVYLDDDVVLCRFLLLLHFLLFLLIILVVIDGVFFIFMTALDPLSSDLFNSFFIAIRPPPLPPLPPLPPPFVLSLLVPLLCPLHRPLLRHHFLLVLSLPSSSVVLPWLATRR